MLHWRFIGRQIDASRQQATIFIACLALSLLTLVSLGGLGNSVRQSMLRDARELHAADIIVHSHYPLSRPLLQAIDKLRETGRINRARTYEFYSMARNEKTTVTTLCQLKIVQPGYPFYGKIELASGRAFGATLTSGEIIVEQEVLDRLGAKIGDTLTIGSALLQVVDVVVREPDRPVSFFSFGPRIFITEADLERLDLLRKGSRIHYNVLVQVNDAASIDKIAAELSKAGVAGQERVETYRTAESGVKRFFENFLFFLNLIGLFTLLLAGFGIHTALIALIRGSYGSIAIMKSIGASNRFISVHFLAIVLLLGLIGTLAGLAACSLLQQILPFLFAGILPAEVTMALDWSEIGEGLLLGTLVAGLFSILPLRRIKELRPAYLFRKETTAWSRDVTYYSIIAFIVIFFGLLTVWQLEDRKIGLYFVLGLACLIGFTSLCTSLLLSLLRKKSPRRLALRQAVRSLYRPGNATRAVIVTLSAALAVIFSISLVERNLHRTFVSSYPEDLPNAYFIDIQPDQKEAFTRLLGAAPQLYPIVRARIASINSKAIDRLKERRRKRDNLAREFNLTYRDYLLEDERMLAGESLFGNPSDRAADGSEVPVSILDTVADMADIGIGDRIEFTVQGFPLKARVVSIRTRQESSARPYFYFVFTEDALIEAPHTLFAALRLDRSQLTAVQNRIVRGLPNISVIDIGKTVEVLAAIMEKLTSVIQFFTLFSIAAGLLIIVSSFLATQYARIREAVYFRVLGARSRFIVSVFSWENILVALLSGLQASIISQVSAWIICSRVLDIAYRPFLLLNCIMLVATILLVLLVGCSASLPVLGKKPVVFLRNERVE